MEKENNKLMLKFSRMFTNSCKTQNISEVIDHKNPIFTSQTPLMKEEQEEYSSVTKLKQPPLICNPRCPESLDHMVRENCIVANPGAPSPRRKITGKYSLLSPAGDFSGNRCPPASPASLVTQRPKRMKEKRKNSKPHLPSNHPFNFSSSNETDFFSSDDEREEEEEEDAIDKTETLFSSLKSVSFSSKSVSLSSDSDPGRVRSRTRCRNRRRRRQRRAAAEVGAVPLQGKVKDTFAVVKSSRDPHSDFRTSMVEMIMEKQIFGSKELEQLLQCFLSLNSPHHHRVILEVFSEICDALFSYCS